MKKQPSKTEDTSPSRRNRRKSATKARIVESALELLSRQEYGATTIEQVTEAADVGKGTFFNYFPSKEHLLNEVGHEQLEVIQALVEKSLAKPRDTKKVFQDLFWKLTTLFADNPILARNLILANLGNDSARELMATNVADKVRWLARLIKQGQSLGYIRDKVNPTLAAYWYLDVYYGNLLYWAMEPPSRKKEWLQFSFDQFWESVAADSHNIRKTSRSQHAGRADAKR
ncbi:MAG TPA: TetR/AcrR family transcriptional regulator [candidate division Zixibacteria bacterium]|nr:TetR/AcrR family transcriptional regulator [candidate division Zixibacteria bacterium]